MGWPRVPVRTAALFLLAGSLGSFTLGQHLATGGPRLAQVARHQPVSAWHGTRAASTQPHVGVVPATLPASQANETHNASTARPLVQLQSAPQQANAKHATHDSTQTSGPESDHGAQARSAPAGMGALRTAPRSGSHDRGDSGGDGEGHHGDD